MSSAPLPPVPTAPPSFSAPSRDLWENHEAQRPAFVMPVAAPTPRGPGSTTLWVLGFSIAALFSLIFSGIGLETALTITIAFGGTLLVVGGGRLR